MYIPRTKVYFILLISYLTMFGCYNSYEQNSTQKVDLDKIDKTWLQENSSLNEITAESFVGEHDLSFFMYTGNLKLNSNATFEFREISDLSESITFGNWNFKSDTAILFSDSIKYIPKGGLISNDSIESKSYISDDGTIFYVYNNSQRSGTKVINDTSYFKLSGNDIERLPLD